MPSPLMSPVSKDLISGSSPNRLSDRPLHRIATIGLEKLCRVVVSKLGVKSPKPLSEANKTAGKKQNLSFYYTKDIKERAIYVFGPFLEKYKYNFPEEWGKIHVSKFSRLYFNFLYYLRMIYIVFFKKTRTTKSIKKSIYGRMQRKI